MTSREYRRLVRIGQFYIETGEAASGSVERALCKIGEFYIEEAIVGLLADTPGGLKLGSLSTILRMAYDETESRVRDLTKQGKIHQPRGRKTEYMPTESERRARGYG